MGLENSGVLYALWSYPAQAPDELSFRDGDMVTILQKPEGSDWWWASLCGREGFVPNNYFGVRCNNEVFRYLSLTPGKESINIIVCFSAFPKGSSKDYLLIHLLELDQKNNFVFQLFQIRTFLNCGKYSKKFL